MLYNPTVPQPGDEANASDITVPLQQAATVLNGNIEDDNIKAVNGSKITAGTVTNAALSTAAGEIGGAWASWTPTTSNFDTTKATLDFAKYAQIGKTVHFRLQYTLTSNAVGSEPTFSLPVAAATGYASYARIGEATYNDVGVQTIYGPVLLRSTTQISAYAYATGATYLQFANITATVPFTWGNTDVIYMQGTYEAA